MFEATFAHVLSPKSRQELSTWQRRNETELGTIVIWEKIEEELSAAVFEAGACLMSYWPGSDDALDLEKSNKSDGSVVTRADTEAEKIVLEAVRRLLPESRIVSEEAGTSGESSAEELCWFIDPLDGTRVFSEGGNDFSVLVALARGGKVIGSMMFFPARDLFISASRAQGMKLRRGAVKLEVSAAPSPRNQRVYCRSWKPVTDMELSRRYDSGDAFLRLASGELDLMIIRMTRLNIWDIAAPSLIVELSGGRVSNERGEPLRFEEASLNARYVVASNGASHDFGLRLIPEAER